ncbi:hypothetical protein R3W88_001735 [Solanum pinnatisectum]|uniref:Uncharacterized protein n=1 Tax=Solanum pinnatisectum TaxID=50273 RepID=A0AAV9MJ56_9SOLN|nr:hypothetical protein R3W88_001735 [Solanum pinnatisectum]
MAVVRWYRRRHGILSKKKLKRRNKSESSLNKNRSSNGDVGSSAELKKSSLN